MHSKLFQIKCFNVQWNPDFSNLQGKRKLVREIEGGIKLRLIGRVLFGYE